MSQVKNSHLSPLAYQGGGLSIQSGALKSWGKQLRSSVFEINLDYYSHPNDESKLQGGGLSYHYFRYYKPYISLPGETDLFIGGGYHSALNILYSPVNINNVVYYSFNNTLDLSFILGKRWDDYFFSNEFSIPIIGIYSTSEYGSSIPYIFFHDDVDVFSSAHIGSLNLNSIFKNSFNFDVIAHTKRKKTYNLRFNYTITYGRQKINNITHRVATHQIGVAYLFNTKHHEY